MQRWFAFCFLFIFRAKMWLINKFGEFCFYCCHFSLNVWIGSECVLLQWCSVQTWYNGEGCPGPATFSNHDDTIIMLQLPDSPAACLVCQSNKKGFFFFSFFFIYWLLTWFFFFSSAGTFSVFFFTVYCLLARFLYVCAPAVG